MPGEDETDERGFLAEQPLAALRGGRKAAERPHFLGHRDRLRERFEKQGDAALADYELLELLLYRSIPRADTKPLAKSLITRFGSLAEVFGAPVERLQEIKGVGASVALDIKAIASVGRRMAFGAIKGREVLSSWAQVLDYCQAAMALETREQFRILFLDKKNALIADEVQQVGTVDHTPVYPREVVRRALELAATALILVHNHPSGDPTPSRADIEMTKTIIEAAKPMGIAIHDHIIIGKNRHASMKGLLLI